MNSAVRRAIAVPYFFIAALLVLLAGCGVGGVPRAVQPVFDATKTFTVLKDFDWYGPYPPSQGVRLRAGVYALEAEDAEYWYFRAPVAIEVVAVERMSVAHGRSVPGGVMLSKRFHIVPAAAYVDDAAVGKRMVLEFGPDFRGMEGIYWKRSFPREVAPLGR